MSAGSRSFRAWSNGTGRELRLEVQMGDLPQGVDAGVGAARAVQLEVGAPRDEAHGGGDLPLDGAGVLLDLPAAVARAGELDDEAEPAHRPSVPGP